MTARPSTKSTPPLATAMRTCQAAALAVGRGVALAAALQLAWSPASWAADALAPSPIDRAARTRLRGATLLDRADTLALEASALPSSDCRDPVFSYLLNLLDRGCVGIVTTEHFRAAAGDSKRASKIPFELIRDVARIPDGRADHVWIRIRFSQGIDVPVPYSLLGYRPGSLRSTAEVTLMEWRLGDLPLLAAGSEGNGAVNIEDVTVWGVIDGAILLDIDGWVDAIMGAALDDTHVVVLAVFRYESQRYALAAGFNDDGHGRSGALHLGDDKIRFPAPDEFKLVGRELRRLTIKRLARHGIAVWPPAG
jgi:hypothetical protein